MKDFCIVGSGVAGSTIAKLLYKKYSVEVFDKARGPGGRAANRKYKNKISFDHGLQFITPKQSSFKKFLNFLKNIRVIKEWNGNHLDFNFEKKKKSIKFIGFKSNNDISKYQLRDIKSKYLTKITHIKYNSNYWTITINKKEKVYFKNLILTCPLPQLKELAKKYLYKKLTNIKIDIAPNITVMAVYKNYMKLPINSIKFKDNTLGFASNENSKKRFKSKLSTWTLQANEDFSNKYIDKYKKNKKKVINIMLKRFQDKVGFKIKDLVFADIHGWKYAYRKKTKVDLNSFWITKYNLGVCADWMLGAKAENAWLSAKNLFEKIKKNPPKKRRV